ncbi:hypothetical protein LV478_11025 [Komagataeibacter oboediens]|uniref:hypothetical protein n=1 Tax=Komagataeibacter oboediens TaxID=65958 RepID=UPI0023DA0068|nr:hypothetical protein [Komagataeibacter oboediens]WEQ51064.1 hypothetical protein LV478_11025 [Komagataeibacter oboediens]
MRKRLKEVAAFLFSWFVFVYMNKIAEFCGKMAFLLRADACVGRLLVEDLSAGLHCRMGGARPVWFGCSGLPEGCPHLGLVRFPW